MRTVVLLVIANIFMTFAWYGHLRHTNSPLWAAILVSWLIAFAAFYLREPVRWNHVAAFILLLGAVALVFGVKPPDGSKPTVAARSSDTLNAVSRAADTPLD